MVGWCDGASSTGASYNLDTVGQGPTALAVGAGGGCLDIFTFLYPFSPFFFIVVLLFYVHGKHLRSCRDGQLT